jgi:hypothetical protein
MDFEDLVEVFKVTGRFEPVYRRGEKAQFVLCTRRFHNDGQAWDLSNTRAGCNEIHDVIGDERMIQHLGNVFVVPGEAFAGELLATLPARELLDRLGSLGLLVQI